jgi:hypothetical protein
MHGSRLESRKVREDVLERTGTDNLLDAMRSLEQPVEASADVKPGDEAQRFSMYSFGAVFAESRRRSRSRKDAREAHGQVLECSWVLCSSLRLNPAWTYVTLVDRRVDFLRRTTHAWSSGGHALRWPLRCATGFWCAVAVVSRWPTAAVLAPTLSGPGELVGWTDSRLRMSQQPITLTTTSRFRGWSSSIKKIRCQRPNISFASRSGIVSLAPNNRCWQ